MLLRLPVLNEPYVLLYRARPPTLSSTERAVSAYCPATRPSVLTRVWPTRTTRWLQRRRASWPGT
eukprot:3500417-Rhodomonas_salina.1